MNNEEVLAMYEDMFGEKPFILNTVSQNDPRYIEMVNEAIFEGKKIDEKLLNKYFNNNYDVIRKTGFEKFKKN